MNKSVPFFVGYASLQSSLSLEEVGEILSREVFGGLSFGGKELDIHEEIPAVFIQNSFMGLKVVLDGYSGFGQDEYFTLSVGSSISFKNVESETVSLDDYLFNLLKIALKDVEALMVIDFDGKELE